VSVPLILQAIREVGVHKEPKRLAVAELCDRAPCARVALSNLVAKATYQLVASLALESEMQRRLDLTGRAALAVPILGRNAAPSPGLLLEAMVPQQQPHGDVATARLEA